MTEDEALAICFANLKGTRKKDLLATARALQFLKSLPSYGSNTSVGAKLNVSGEMVREFLVLLQLPIEIQSLLDQRQLSLDQGRRLWQLERDRPEALSEMVEAISDLTVVESRQLIDYVLKNRDIPLSDAKNRLLETRTITERQYHVIALLPAPRYRQLEQQARQQKVAINDLVTSVVLEWLDKSN